MLLLFFILLQTQTAAHPLSCQTITFNEKQEYGKNTQWDNLFLYDRGYSICANGSGQVFVTDSIGNRVYIFDSKGDFIGSFGQKGQGPGDLEKPLGISTYFNTTLVICESPMIRTVAIHTADSHFNRKIRLQHAPRNAWLTTKSDLVYLACGLEGQASNSMWYYILFHQVGCNIQDERVIKKTIKKNLLFFYDDTTKMYWPSGIYPNLAGEMLVTTNQNGQVLVGCTDEKSFDFYEPGMLGKRTLTLNLERSDQVKRYIEQNKKRILQENDTTVLEFLKDTRLVRKFKQLKPELNTLPYYRKIFLDDSGRIYLFMFEPEPDHKRQLVTVFSTSGKFLRSFILDLSPFSIFFDSIFYESLFSISDQAIFAMLPKKTEGDDIQFKIYCEKIM